MCGASWNNEKNRGADNACATTVERNTTVPHSITQQRTGLRRGLERILESDAATVGFVSRKGAERRQRVLGLGADLDSSNASAGHSGLDFVILMDGQPPEGIALWGRRARDGEADDTERGAFQVLSLGHTPALALDDKYVPSVLELDQAVPPEFLRTLNGLHLEAVIVPAQQIGEGSLAITDLLRLGMLAAGLKVPVIARTAGVLQQGELALLAQAGVAAILVSGSGDVATHISQLRAEIDAIDPRVRNGRDEQDHGFPTVQAFGGAREPEQHEEPAE